MAKRKTNPFKKFTDAELEILSTVLAEKDFWGVTTRARVALRSLCEGERSCRADARMEKYLADVADEKAGA